MLEDPREALSRMGNTSSQPLPKDELSTLWTTPSRPVQHSEDNTRSPSLPTSNINTADGTRREMDELRAAKEARKQQRKEKRQRKEAKLSRRASRALTSGSEHQSDLTENENNQDFPDPSSQLLLEAAEHINKNDAGTRAGRKKDIRQDGKRRNHSSIHIEDFSNVQSRFTDQSNIDPSLRDMSHFPLSTEDVHRQQLLDWHEKQNTNGRSGANQQMQTVQVQDGVFAMVPQSGGLGVEFNGSVANSQNLGSMENSLRDGGSTHAVSRSRRLTTPSRSRTIAQAATMINMSPSGAENGLYNVSQDSDMNHNIAPYQNSSNGGSRRKSSKQPKATKRKSRNEVANEKTLQEASQPPKKRARKSINTDAPEEEVLGDVAPIDSSQAPLPTSGPFVKIELDCIERVARSFRDRQDMTPYEFNEMVQNKDRGKNDVRDDFWQRMYDNLPNRQHVAIQRCARRRYHNYESRGKWTTEEDETLKTLYTSYPQKWVQIGKDMARMPEDCRDRWRNYLSAEDSKRGVEWTQKEEVELSHVVQECASLIRRTAKSRAAEKNAIFQEEDWISQVNYNTVSTKMGHSRTRLQCYQHWRLMQKRDKREEVREEQEPKTVWRKRSALKRYQEMTPRDKVDILRAIKNSDTLEEHRVPWRLFRRTAAEAKWTSMDRKVAFEKMKKLIPPQSTLQETVDKLMNYFQRHHKKQLEEPEVDEEEAGKQDAEDEREHEQEPISKSKKVGKSSAATKGPKRGTQLTTKTSTKRKEAPKAKKPRGKRGVELSTEKVVDSSEDEAAETEIHEDRAASREYVDVDEEPTSGQPEPDEDEAEAQAEDEEVDDGDMVTAAQPKPSNLFDDIASASDSEAEMQEDEASSEDQGEDDYDVEEDEDVDDQEIKSESNSGVSPDGAGEDNGEEMEDDDADSMVVRNMR